MRRPLEPDDWEPPPALAPRPDGLPGALGGSRLYERPEHHAFRDRILAFVDGSGRLALDIGIDHGARFLDHARRFPEIRWLGAEIRRARVQALLPHLPENAAVVRADARTLLHALIPAGRLAYVLVLFPSPSNDPRHLLVTPGFVTDVARALAPDGVVHLATDVPGMARWAAACFEGWSEGEDPPTGPVLTRRERVCARDGRPVWRATYRPRREGG